MIRTCWLAAILLFVGPTMAQSDQSAQAPASPDSKQAAQTAPGETPKTLVDAINITWADEERDLVALADEMPAEKWDFKPTRGEFKDVRTFGEMVKHVACANEGFAKEMRGATPPEGCEKGGPNPAKNKSEVMKYLHDSFAMLDDEINMTNEKNEMQPVDGPYGGPNTRIGMVVLATWHVADHYGQLVEYARMNGIVPPASRPAPAPSK
jgi:DinB superfamily